MELKNSKKNNSNPPTNDISKQKQFFLEKVARFCDKCGTPYGIDDVEILQKNEYSTIIHFSCKNCKARHLATFIRPLGITSRMPVNTDLSVEEIARFANKPGISSNDVLDVHEFLKNPKLTVNDILKTRV